jgi:hypothetical protein
VKIVFEIDEFHLAMLEALAARYSVDRDQFMTLLIAAAVKREDEADIFRAVMAELLGREWH